MINVSSFSFRYEKKGMEILQNIDFSLEKGQIGILLGPNGAGKSTLLKSIVGLLKPQAGDIKIDGVSILDLSPKERAKKIAYVPQILSFEPARVYDVVMLGRLPYFSFVPTAQDHEIVKSVLEELGLSHLQERNVISLSGGERQKIAIARALVQGSDIIVFDEPTSNLDISGETLIGKEVETLAKKYQKTVILSMHDLNLAYRLGDYFLFLRDGKVVATGDKTSFTPTSISSSFGIEVKKIETEDGIFFITKGSTK